MNFLFTHHPFFDAQLRFCDAQLNLVLSQFVRTFVASLNFFVAK